MQRRGGREQVDMCGFTRVANDSGIRLLVCVRPPSYQWIMRVFLTARERREGSWTGTAPVIHGVQCGTASVIGGSTGRGARSTTTDAGRVAAPACESVTAWAPKTPRRPGLSTGPPLPQLDSTVMPLGDVLVFTPAERK